MMYQLSTHHTALNQLASVQSFKYWLIGNIVSGLGAHLEFQNKQACVLKHYYLSRYDIYLIISADIWANKPLAGVDTDIEILNHGSMAIPNNKVFARSFQSLIQSTNNNFF